MAAERKLHRWTRRNEINWKIWHLNANFNLDLKPDFSCGGVRIMDAGTLRDLSPRGTKRDIIVWLEGFREAMLENERRKA